MTKRSYRHPPIEEALCEFKFVSDGGWDLTIPGKLHSRVQSEYDGKPQEQKVVRANISRGGGGPPSVGMSESLGRITFPARNANRMLGVGTDILAVHTLRPYDGWEQFRPRIATALDAYHEVANPSGVQRIGLRYINRISVPSTTVQLEDYFACAPATVPQMPQQMTAFLHRDEYSYQDGIKLILNFGSIQAPRGESAFVLDLDVTWEGENAMSLADAMVHVESLHTREGEAFEALVRDPARNLFDAV